MPRTILHISQILEWADAHFERTGKWPTRVSGRIPWTEEKWANIVAALYRGSRGLPENWPLARLLQDFRGRRNPRRPPPLQIEQILQWADAHHKRTGSWPDRRSGKIPGTEEHWGAIGAALEKGGRGLPGGSSIAQLLAVHRGLRNSGRLQPFRIEQILEWADEHRDRTGEWPNPRSGQVADTEETWAAIQMALVQGGRGLPGNCSIPQLLAAHRGSRNPKKLPLLTIQQILTWADGYRERTGQWPTRTSGPIQGTDETWASVDAVLRRGSRGLPADYSLARLLAEHRGRRNNNSLPALRIKQILAWADRHHNRTGRWPNQKSGCISGTEERWQQVDQALRNGQRGLPGGSSLANLLQDSRGVRNPRNVSQLSQMQILEWADACHERTGLWPQQKTGPIPEAPGETWSYIDEALRNQSRGLRSRSSLARLLLRHRGVHPYQRQPILSAEQIRKWAQAYEQRTGRRPTLKSGPIPEAPAETWSKIDAALKAGRRGLTARCTLFEFLTERRRPGTPRRTPLTIKQILVWADEYFERHAQWPTRDSGKVLGVRGENWNSINAALHDGCRSLKAGSSLNRLIQEYRGER